MFLPGWKVIRSSTQISRLEMTQTGMAMKNQVPHVGSGSIFCISKFVFCGDDIGEAAPPMFEAEGYSHYQMPWTSAF